jgi:threonine aldolase
MLDPRFASDNTAPVLPGVWEALRAADVGPAAAYGDDAWTVRLTGVVRDALGWPEALVLPLWGGTAANVLALRSVTSPVDAVLCATSSHLLHAECGAPWALAGVQPVPVAAPEGKVTPETLAAGWPDRDGDHRSRNAVLSVAQATERGTVYAPAALAALAEDAHARGLLVHVDGARLPVAAAALGVSLGEAARGADVLSLGGTKAGLLGAEAVVWRHPALAPQAGRHRKQLGQLPSKLRYVSAQLVALLEDDAWRAPCLASLAAARALADGLVALGASLAAPVESNAVFVFLPADVRGRLDAVYAYEVFDQRTGLSRFVAAWDVTEADVARLLAVARGA